jgi:myo-inositol-1(or 4)-monophosphatase
MVPADTRLEQILEFASNLAEDVGRMALKYFGRAEARLKEDRTWVTDADLAVQETILKKIDRNYPDHAVLGEESANASFPGQTTGESDYTWVVDPIDGTDAFRAGFPVWGISIGLIKDGDPLLGVIHLPLLDETYQGIVNRGATLNGHRIEVAPDEEINDLSLLLVPSDYHRRFRSSFPGKIRAMGSVAAHAAYVARGSAAGCLTEAYIWDLAAGLAIVKAAGGDWRHIDGSEFDLRRHLNREKIKPPILISNPQLLKYWLKSITELD